MKLVDCTYDKHAAAILEIFNDAILNSTALYDYRARSLDNMRTWFDTKSAGRFPVIGIEDEAGLLTGFASFGTFRAWPAYKYTVEHSIYVHPEHRGLGIGKLLLAEIIKRARNHDVHVMVGGIDAENAASIALHEQFGFTHAGTIRQAGYKFGRWLDLAFYQLILETPECPVDG